MLTVSHMLFGILFLKVWNDLNNDILTILRKSLKCSKKLYLQVDVYRIRLVISMFFFLFAVASKTHQNYFTEHPRWF